MATRPQPSSPRGLSARILLLAGSIGPLGHLPASGTLTVAIVGIPLFWIMSGWGPITYVAITLVFSMLAIRLHDVGDRLLGEKDSRKLVWDELAGFFVAVAFVPFTWKLAVIAFLVERALDIAKVFPANVAERKLQGGLGVVADDLIAGLYTCLLLHGLLAWAPSWMTS